MVTARHFAQQVRDARARTGRSPMRCCSRSGRIDRLLRRARKGSRLECAGLRAWGMLDHEGGPTCKRGHLCLSAADACWQIVGDEVAIDRS